MIRKFYNEEYKERFINERIMTVIASREYLTSVFKRVSQFEAEYGRDACEFNTYEIKNMYKAMNTSSLNALSVLNATLAGYTFWCIKEGLKRDIQNHYNEVSREDLQGCINIEALKVSVLSKKKLLSVVDTFINPMDKYVVMALFEGIRGNLYSDIVNLQITDIEGNIVHLPDRDISVGDEFLKFAKEAYNSSQYFVFIKGGIHVYELRERKDKEIFRTMAFRKNIGERPGLNTCNWIRKYVKAALEGAGVNIGLQDIINSGKIYFILEECKKYGVTPKEYIFNPELFKAFKNKFKFKSNKTELREKVELFYEG